MDVFRQSKGVAVRPVSVLIEDGDKGIAIATQDICPGCRLILAGIHMQYCPHQRKRYTDSWTGWTVIESRGQ
jgi:hypothetical protein